MRSNNCPPVIVIGISGKRGSGKDTLANAMSKYGWQRLSFAAELKARCRSDFGLTEEQTDGVFKESPTQYRRVDGSFYTPRDIMVRCGFYYRSIDPMFWVRKVYDHLATVDPAWDIGHRKFVITDVRFKNEANYIREHGGYVIRLERDPALSIYKGNMDDPSETELDDYDFDYVVPAEGNVNLTDLENTAGALELLYGSF